MRSVLELRFDKAINKAFYPLADDVGLVDDVIVQTSPINLGSFTFQPGFSRGIDGALITIIYKKVGIHELFFLDFIEHHILGEGQSFADHIIFALLRGNMGDITVIVKDIGIHFIEDNNIEVVGVGTGIGGTDHCCIFAFLVLQDAHSLHCEVMMVSTFLIDVRIETAAWSEEVSDRNTPEGKGDQEG